MPQNVLCYARAAVLAYAIAAGVMILDYKLEDEESEHSNWRHFFDFSLVSFFLLICYHAVVSVRFPRLDDLDPPHSVTDKAFCTGLDLHTSVLPPCRRIWYRMGIHDSPNDVVASEPGQSSITVLLLDVLHCDPRLLFDEHADILDGHPWA
jgi:hypothetical protein